MACNISLGRNEPCKDSIAGLTGIYFINYTTGSFTLNATDQVTAFPSGTTAYYYELKGANGYTETVNTSRDNGTTFFSQALAIQLKKLSAETTKEFKLLAYGRPQIVVTTRQGDSLLVGRLYGADVTAGVNETGVQYGDHFGYKYTFTGMEPLPANFISGSVVGSPFGSATNAPTVVYGTNS